MLSYETTMTSSPVHSVRQNLLLSDSSGNNNNNNNKSSNMGSVYEMDDFKFIRTMLPNFSHMIDSATVSDAHNWACDLHVALATESDCLTWLNEFSDNTKTDWEVDNTIAVDPIVNGRHVAYTWGVVCRCASSRSIKDPCSARLEMKILHDSEFEKRSSYRRDYPCFIQIGFYHNHSIQGSSSSEIISQTAIGAVATENQIRCVIEDSFKVLDVSTATLMKDHFDGFFLSTEQHAPVSALASLSDKSVDENFHPIDKVVNLNHIQPVSKRKQQVSEDSSRERDKNDNETVASVEKLREVFSVMEKMLKKKDKQCSSVNEFINNFCNIRDNEHLLENALRSFGSDPTATFANNNIVTCINNSANVIMSPTFSTPQWSLTPLAPISIATTTPINANSSERLLTVSSKSTTSIQSAVSENRDQKTKEKASKTHNAKQKKPQRFSSSKSTVLPGQIDPVTGKRKKRSRCGECQGCINRDRIQDCQTCRNCMDQKRYGGPGKLKKACVKRSCVIMATSEGLAPPFSTTTSTTTASGATSAITVNAQTSIPISLPQHPVPVTSDASMSIFRPGKSSRRSWLLSEQADNADDVDDVENAGMSLSFIQDSSLLESEIQLEKIAAEAARRHGIE